MLLNTTPDSSNPTFCITMRREFNFPRSANETILERFDLPAAPPQDTPTFQAVDMKTFQFFLDNPRDSAYADTQTELSIMTVESRNLKIFTDSAVMTIAYI